MKLHEYQSKQLFAKYGIPIPKGRVATSAGEAQAIAEELGGHVVVKAQVLVGGRGKAGGIKLAKTPDEAAQLAAQILAMEIKGMPVRKVLIDEAAAIDTELYFAVATDRAEHKPVMIASAAGGIDIEDVAARTPEKIAKLHVDPLLGLRDYQARDLAGSIDLHRDYWKDFGRIAASLWRLYTESDSSIAEINPLVITKDKRLVALDGKMVIDDNALFRQHDLGEMRDQDEELPGEIEARKYGLSYIKLNGDIGCMVNGAGLAMTSMDIVKLFGGEPANFLDIGGGAGADKVAAAMRIIMADPNVKAILLNIFGGITRCDEVAHGILAATSKIKPKAPMVVRLVGTNAKEARQLLADAQIITAETLAEAAKKAVAAAKGAKP